MSILNQELSICAKVMRNRIAFPPMANGLATDDGAAVPEHNDHYAVRAKEGVALVIVEHSYVHPSGKAGPGQLAIDRDELVEGLTALASSIKAQGALAAIQITHGGSKTKEEVIGQTPVAPSAVPYPGTDVVPKELSAAEMDELKECYVQAALRAERAGFDAVEVHGAHGYLLCEFLSPLTNKRTDDYGGSEEARARYPLEVVGAVKAALKDDTILMYRLGVDDLLPGGLTMEETSRFGVMLEDNGVDLIDVSGALSAYMIVDKKPGYFRAHSRAIKDLVSIPVMMTGGVKTAEFAEEILKSGDADIIGIGRALLANPAWASEALNSV